ncbi:OPT oligopeptide transporter [Boletus reticuloceps]|uniref:OPT oligopeptide transporter n=1 Tax=Boletus reticuloceps TaxID=495285 RepID=A0A8I3A855_9AGAM|nr:OPT oligopeptide transporter [Boletus reticuloceps]
MSLDDEHNSLGFAEKEKQADDLGAPLPVADFDDPNINKDEALAGIIGLTSPYPEVRSAVANTDDVTIPCGTLRAWVLGIIWAIIVPGMNQFFFFRYPSVTVTNNVAQLLSFPMGQFWARVVPNWKIFGISINPGPFTIKEHVLVTMMATVGYQSAYATDIIAVQRVYYNQIFNFSYQWMVVMSTQMIGFSLGGVMRRFLVEPPSMIWPTNLVYCALFNTLHAQVYAGMGTRGGLTRGRFFIYVWAGGLLWYFLPGYLFQALSFFTWVCWIAPKNVVVNQLFGYESGLGMSLMTFDWAQITYIGSPLASPWWAEVNVIGGFVVFFWILTPILHFTNTWYAAYMPMSSRISYDNTGASYNVTKILTPNNELNLTAYENYSPLFLSTTFALAYGLSFASITATIVHALLFFRKQIWTQARRALREQPDIHSRLMSKYRQVPEWWYMCVFVVMFVFGVIAIELFPTEFPVWGFVLSLVIAFFYIIPIGMIQAITNQQVGLNVITELIVGYAIPGRPLAMMLFKTWGYITMYQALQFASDFKLGHYMKIPPRQMFACLDVYQYTGHVHYHAEGWLHLPQYQVFGTASVIWGVIGPQRQFSSGQIYNSLLWFFLLGAICPVIAWLAQKRWPNSWIRYLNFPVIFSGTGLIPPASAVNYVTWGIVGFIFQYFIRRRHFSWWTKYNYVLSAALDTGLACSVILIFFCLQYPDNGTIGLNSIQTWWGNTVFLKTADGQSATLRAVNGTFGPSTW